MEERDLQESFWLCSITGIGTVSAKRLLEKAGSVGKVAGLSMQEEVLLLGEKRALLLERAKEEGARKNARIGLERLREKGIAFLPQWHEDFPARLLHIPDPPLMLFVKGKLPPKECKQAALVGARACSAYGREMAEYFGSSLAVAGVGIVSGMARGIDGMAQRAALSVGGHSTAVLGCGVDICYPPENLSLYRRLEREGCLLSEYMPGAGPDARLFPARNRIISGLADLLLVIEAREKSGTLITVDMALEQGREVYAVPGRIQDVCSRGCNKLIENGAGIATKAAVILEALGYTVPKQSKLTGTAKGQGTRREADSSLRGHILEILSQKDRTPDEILAILKSARKDPPVVSVLMRELLLLCVEGKIREEGGRYFFLALQKDMVYSGSR